MAMPDEQAGQVEPGLDAGDLAGVGDHRVFVAGLPGLRGIAAGRVMPHLMPACAVDNAPKHRASWPVEIHVHHLVERKLAGARGVAKAGRRRQPQPHP